MVDRIRAGAGEFRHEGGRPLLLTRDYAAAYREAFEWTRGIGYPGVVAVAVPYVDGLEGVGDRYRVPALPKGSYVFFLPPEPRSRSRTILDMSTACVRSPPRSREEIGQDVNWMLAWTERFLIRRH